MNITIITPLYRENLLYKVAESIPKGVRWVVVGQCPVKIESPKNAELYCIDKNDAFIKKNYGIEKTSDGYLYFLDDDTIIHPNFREFLNMKPIYDMIYFNQVDRKGRYRCGKTLAIHHTDMGAILVKRTLLGDTIRFKKRFPPDGYFIEECAKAAKSIHYINKPISYYNYLRPIFH